MENASIILEMLERIQALEKQVKELQEKSERINSIDLNSISTIKNDYTPISSYDYETKKRDTTKYLFNGAVYSKNRLVLTVVKDYVENNRVSFQELNKIFHPSLQGSIGVFESASVARNRQDYKVRFFTSEEDVVVLDDCSIYVCNQWGILNIPRFLSRAKDLGYDIKEIK